MTTVYMWPKVNPENKFNELLSNSIEENGFRVEEFNKYMVKNMKNGDVLHMHWPSFHYEGKSLISTWLRCIKFVLFLLIIKKKGVKLFWTMHNLWPHKTGKCLHNKLMRRFLLKICNVIFIMSESMKIKIKENFGKTYSNIVYVPHGSYKGVYPKRGIDIRKKFGIPENAYVYGFLGQVSPYKGIWDLIDNFNKLDDDSYLLIAGKLSKDIDENELRNITNNKTILDLRFIENEEIVDYFNAFNSTVLPYKEITTSGTAVLALSNAVPVVIPNIGLISDYVPHGCGVLYDPKKSDGLSNALNTVKNIDQRVFLESQMKLMEKLDWGYIGELICESYKK
ncbi:glycosyltransferase family 4 protein [Terribacillus halophilus]|uniref:glycosyltransferase family 4 protein n=1 Tax=Terribacillus halophilus TaxID=361279 RepID=UPI0039822D12